MEAKKVTAEAKVLLDPAASEWGQVAAETISMGGTPVAQQPSRYIRTSWSDRPIGNVRSLTVRSAHNSKEVFFLLEWSDPTKNDGYVGRDFPDGAGILFPLKGDAPLQSMGRQSQAVNAWFWRADFEDGAKNVTASGIGTVEETEKSAVAARGQWQDGTWRVVFARPLAVAEQKEQAVQLEAGQSVKVAFAIWEGSSGERAGIKSFSKTWRELTLEG
ncbi:MAG: ethylbenzene dehydrogenase-related protein [Chloroflexota bacterium]|nr:ethylbenzene dehydrogenase-related protein [Chloroflexota bacterium]